MCARSRVLMFAGDHVDLTISTKIAVQTILYQIAANNESSALSRVNIHFLSASRPHEIPVYSSIEHYYKHY